MYLRYVTAVFVRQSKVRSSCTDYKKDSYLSDLIVSERQSIEITAKEASVGIGISHGTVTKLERGSLDLSLERLASILRF